MQRQSCSNVVVQTAMTMTGAWQCHSAEDRQALRCRQPYRAQTKPYAIVEIARNLKSCVQRCQQSHVHGQTARCTISTHALVPRSFRKQHEPSGHGNTAGHILIVRLQTMCPWHLRKEGAPLPQILPAGSCPRPLGGSVLRSTRLL